MYLSLKQCFKHCVTPLFTDFNYQSGLKELHCGKDVGLSKTKALTPWSCISDNHHTTLPCYGLRCRTTNSWVSYSNSPVGSNVGSLFAPYEVDLKNNNKIRHSDTAEFTPSITRVQAINIPFSYYFRLIRRTDIFFAKSLLLRELMEPWGKMVSMKIKKTFRLFVYKNTPHAYIWQLEFIYPECSFR